MSNSMTDQNAALLPATARRSAQVIPLPGAAVEPVQQRRRAGRHPKSVVNLQRFRLDRMFAKPAPTKPTALAASTGTKVQQELKDAQNFHNAAKRAYDAAVYELQQAQQAARFEAKP